jgi:2-polyprenyl-6-methoxyphenol hydroxylase-like FAD-dependent oxidoreductase
MTRSEREWPQPASAACETSVLVVGAGPAGLTLAIDLARRGTACRIIEGSPSPRNASRGKGLQPRTLEVFDDLGVVDKVLAEARPYPLIRAYDGRTVLSESYMHEHCPPRPDRPYPNIVMLPQWRTEELLRVRLAELGVHVEFGTQIIGFDQDALGVNACVAMGESERTIRAAYLVGADGGRSTVRRTLGIRFEGETSDAERALFGDVRAEGLDRDHWHIWPKAPGGMLALCPLPGSDRYQFSAQLAAGDTPAQVDDAFQQIFAERVGWPEVRLYDPSWFSLYRFNARLAQRYRQGRVFLAGDAAHVHSAAGGQGLNTSVQDAYNLGWKLGQVLAGAPESLLDTFEEERRQVAADVLDLSTRLHREGLARPSRDRRDPSISQLELSYRCGSIARELRKQPGSLQAGDRAPDGLCVDGEGRQTRLFDLFRGPHFTLLAFGADAALAARSLMHARADVQVAAITADGGERGQPTLRDADANVSRAYDVRGGALMLIRPDGYIGLSADASALDQINAYLAQVSAGVVTNASSQGT